MIFDPYPYEPNPRRVRLEEHFLTGRSSQPGQIGVLGWGYTSPGGSLAVVNSEPGHAGILRVQSGASANNFTNVVPQYDWYTFYSQRLSAGYWLRVNQVDTHTLVKAACFGVTPWGVALASWCGIEKGASDTTWKLVTSLNTNITSVDSGIAVDTDWIYLESAIRDGVAYFSINGIRVASITTNVPEGLVGAPFFQIANDTAANKTLDVDYAYIYQEL